MLVLPVHRCAKLQYIATSAGKHDENFVGGALAFDTLVYVAKSGLFSISVDSIVHHVSELIIFDQVDY